MSRLPQVQLIGILSISSLMCTAYILISLPHSKLKEAYQSSMARPFVVEPKTTSRYIEYLNGGLTFIIGLNALVYRGRQGVHDGFWLLCVLPGGQQSITLWINLIILRTLTYFQLYSRS